MTHDFSVYRMRFSRCKILLLELKSENAGLFLEPYSQTFSLQLLSKLCFSRLLLFFGFIY